jgi:hypothetical protein
MAVFSLILKPASMANKKATNLISASAQKTAMGNMKKITW